MWCEGSQLGMRKDAGSRLDAYPLVERSHALVALLQESDISASV